MSRRLIPLLAMATILAHAEAELGDDFACATRLGHAGFDADDVWRALYQAQRLARQLRAATADQLLLGLPHLEAVERHRGA